MIIYFVVCGTLPIELSAQCLSPSNVMILNLETAINYAFISNRTLISANDAVYVADVSEELARSDFELKMRPRADTGVIGGGKAGTGFTAGLALDLDKKLPIGTQITASPAVLKASDRYHANFSLRIMQPLLRGFGVESTRAGIKAAEYASRSANRSLQRSIIVVVYRTIELMYEIVKQEELLKLDQETYVRLEKFLKTTKIKERIGLSDALDVYRAEIELKQAEEALMQSRERLQDNKDALIDHLALPSDTQLIVDLQVSDMNENWNQEEAIDTALQNRIELEEAWDQLCEAKRLARLAKKDMLPELNLVLDYSNLGYGEEFTGAFGKKRESRWGIGFTTSTNSDRNTEEVAYERSVLTVENAERACLDLKNAIILEVKRGLRFYQRAKEKIALQQRQVKSVEGELKLAKIKFLRGMANNFDVIQAEKSLRSAQTALVNALIEHNLGTFKLRAAVGLLVDRE